jgi:hypothetical protein
MKRPVGVLALAILTFLEGVYQVYLTLIWLGVVGFEFAGKTVRPGEAQWGQALLAGILAVLYFVVAYGFWTVRVWSWIYGVFITTYNLFSLTVVVLGPVLTLEAVIVPILINLLILGYLIAPGMRARFADSEGSRMDAMMDERQTTNLPPLAPAPPAPAPAAAPAAPEAPSEGSGS